MRGPTAPVPEFDDRAPWGRFRPEPPISLMLAVAHRLPRWLKPVTRALRRPVKYHHPTPLDLTIWGLRLRLLPRGNASEQKLLSAPQLFDPEEFRLVRRLLLRGGVMVDVGANAGAYSFWADRCMDGRGRVIAVEPDPEMRRRLAFNIATNGLTGIEVHPLALSDHDGTAVLQVNPGQRGTNTLEPGQVGRTGVTVPVVTLTALLDRCGVTSVDVLKLDIEGHEPAVLRHFLTHAPDSLLPRAVISEFKPDTQTEILALMRGRGYVPRETTRMNFIFERTAA